MSNKIKQFILLLGDILILYFSLFITLLIRYQKIPSYQTWEAHFWPFTIVFIFWIIIFYIANLYSITRAINNINFIKTLILVILINGSIAILFFYFYPHTAISPKTNLLIYLAVFAILFSFWRYLYNWLLNAYLPRHNIIIIGYNEHVQEIITDILEKPSMGYHLIAVFTDKAIAFENILTVSDIAKLKEVIKKNEVATVVVAANLYDSPLIRSELFACLPLDINIISLSNFYESISGKVPIEAIDKMWFLENLTKGRKILFDHFKRIYDIFFSAIFLALTVPSWFFIGLIIKMDSSGPIFFRQKRAGKDNEPFVILKFRTMTVSNNDYSPTEKNDARITKIGKILRKTRIDELPQLLNIFFGDMSFVGPRPERPELIKELTKKIPFYEERMLVKPGLTGWDQISGEYHSPSDQDSLKKLQYDLYYIKNRSIYLDLSIILKTISTVLSSKGR